VLTHLATGDSGVQGWASVREWPLSESGYMRASAWG
jgi:hypothetical protein